MFPFMGIIAIASAASLGYAAVKYAKQAWYSSVPENPDALTTKKKDLANLEQEIAKNIELSKDNRLTPSVKSNLIRQHRQLQNSHQRLAKRIEAIETRRASSEERTAARETRHTLAKAHEVSTLASKTIHALASKHSTDGVSSPSGAQGNPILSFFSPLFKV